MQIDVSASGKAYFTGASGCACIAEQLLDLLAGVGRQDIHQKLALQFGQRLAKQTRERAVGVEHASGSIERRGAGLHDLHECSVGFGVSPDR